MQYRGTKSIQRVAVIGAGVIGAGWAAAYLARGFEVAAYDPSAAMQERASTQISRAWSAMLELDLCAGDYPSLKLSFAPTLADAIQNADLVHESCPERLEFKASLLRGIDAIVPQDVLIASSTSSLPITELQKGCRFPDRVILGHPYNPVHLMPLVEIGGGHETSPLAIDTIEALYIAMRKHPIRVRKEVFGHITNRLASALFREAVWLVANDYATVGDVEDALRFGPALKWAIQGQYSSFHTTGGEGGFANFLHHFSPGMMKRWATFETPDLADPGLQQKLTDQLQQYLQSRTVDEVSATQDKYLIALLSLLESKQS